jgi:hypothetical protein
MAVRPARNPLRGRLAGFLVATALGVSGCDDRVLNIVENQGQLCVTPAGDPGSNPGNLREYKVDEPLKAEVSFNVCLTVKASDPMASCAIEQAGSNFLVTAQGSYFDTKPPKTLGCYGLHTYCETAAVPAGTYTFEYAGNSLELVVPSSGPIPCVGTAIVSLFY